jgi:hypothetical protein
VNTSTRPGLAAALVAAPLLWLAAEASSPALKSDTDAQLSVIAAHPDRWYAYTLLLLFGSILFIPGVIGLARLTRAASPRLTNLAVTLLGYSMVIACCDVMTQLTAWKAIGAGVDRTQMTDLFARIDDAPGIGVLYATGGLSFLVGSVLLSVALSRVPQLPRWSAVGFGLSMAVQLVGFSTSSIPAIAASAALALTAVLPPARMLIASRDQDALALQAA